LMRGGAFSHPPELVRSANRDANQPGYRYVLVGFRPARTYP
jgi:formylglycine-generating enzyme required for sulfatase activity